MKGLEKYPDLKKRLETLCEDRRNGILTQILESDDEYAKLSTARAEASMALRNVLDNEKAVLFERYSDSVYAQEVYELDALYRQVIQDTLEIMKDCGLI